MQAFSEATYKPSNVISIASDYVGTLANNSKLLNLLATQIVQEKEVAVFSSSPPTGGGLEMFLLSARASLDIELTHNDFNAITSIKRKQTAHIPHFNIVFDDEEVDWCTYDYHIQAGTMAFDEFMNEHERNPNKNLMDIASDLSIEFKNNGINVGTSIAPQFMRKEL